MAKPTIRFKGYTEDWEQRKLGELVIDHNAGIYISKEDYGEGTNVIGVGNIYDRDIFDGEIYRLGPVNDDKFILEENDILYGESSLVPEGIARTVCVGKNGAGSAFAWHTRRVKLDKNIVNSHVATLELNYLHDIRKYLVSVSTQTALTGMTTEGYFGATLTLPSVEEQQKISDYFKNLDNLITLHHHKLFIINGLKLFTVMQCKCYLLLNISNKNKKTKKEIKLMPELERVIEEKLIDQLVYGDSQWTYREDLKTEEDLWRNFKYILEQNNKDRLNGESLSDAEFEQVKNQLQFSSFYKAGEWLVGENGKVETRIAIIAATTRSPAATAIPTSTASGIMKNQTLRPSSSPYSEAILYFLLTSLYVFPVLATRSYAFFMPPSVGNQPMQKRKTIMSATIG